MKKPYRYYFIRLVLLFGCPFLIIGLLSCVRYKNFEVLGLSIVITLLGFFLSVVYYFTQPNEKPCKPIVGEER